MPFGKKPCEHDAVVGCDDCRKKRQAEYIREYKRKRRLEDPSFREQEAATQRQVYARKKQDPAKAEKMREYERERARRRIQDPEYREKKNAQTREYYDRPDIQERHSETMKAYRNRPEIKQREREYGRKHRAKILVYAPGQSEAGIIAEQNGLCGNPRCRRLLGDLATVNIHVDHDHTLTDGRPNVRGVLCRGCNLALGNARDSSDILLGLVEYREAWAQKQGR